MSEVLLILAVLVITWFFGYLISVFSNSIYIDPDDIESSFPSISERRRKQLERFIRDPRAFFQLALLVRVSAAIIVGIASLYLARHTTNILSVPNELFYAVILFLGWLITILLFIYLPRRTPKERVRISLIKFLPLVSILYYLGEPLINLFRRTIPARREKISEDDKDDIVERAIETLAETAGIGEPIIEADEKEMIHQIFQLDVTEAEEIMVPRLDIIGFDVATTLSQISTTVKKHGFSRYPVFRENLDNIVGILKVKDLLHLTDQERHNFKILDHIRDPLRVGERKKIDQILADFKRTKTHMAIVMDEFGGTSGLVTLEDILEEIVGDIEDEDDTPQDVDLKPLENGNWQVSGSLSLEELAEELGFELEQDDFETVGGLLYDLAGSVPHEGETYMWNNLRLKVIELDGQRIIKVLIITG